MMKSMHTYTDMYRHRHIYTQTHVYTHAQREHWRIQLFRLFGEENFGERPTKKRQILFHKEKTLAIGH